MFSVILWWVKRYNFEVQEYFVPLPCEQRTEISWMSDPCLFVWLPVASGYPYQPFDMFCNIYGFDVTPYGKYIQD